MEIPATIKRRFAAFGIDVFVVYLLRFFYINFAIQFWLMRHILDFLKQYEELFGKVDFERITNIEVSFFLKSGLFAQLKWFIVGLFLIPIFYNMIFFFTKWSATIGQKILGIYVVSKNGMKMKFYQVIARSILLVVPWILSFFIILNQYLVAHKMASTLSNSSFVLFVLLFLSWYDLALLTKNKLTFHDYATLTKVVLKDSKNDDNKKSIFAKLFSINFVEGFREFKDNIKSQFKKAKEFKEKYKNKK